MPSNARLTPAPTPRETRWTSASAGSQRAARRSFARTLCAWCEEVIGTAAPNAMSTETNYGMCDDCVQRQLPQLRMLDRVPKRQDKPRSKAKTTPLPTDRAPTFPVAMGSL